MRAYKFLQHFLGQTCIKFFSHPLGSWDRVISRDFCWLAILVSFIPFIRGLATIRWFASPYFDIHTQSSANSLDSNNDIPQTFACLPLSKYPSTHLSMYVLSYPEVSLGGTIQCMFLKGGVSAWAGLSSSCGVHDLHVLRWCEKARRITDWSPVLAPVRDSLGGSRLGHRKA